MGEERNEYRFRTRWTFSAAPDDVFAALAELVDYPTWWPEVRVTTVLDADRCQMTIRSVLPYDLSFVTARSRLDRHAGILEAALSGDLQGVSRWTVAASPNGTVAVFDETVVAHKALLRRLALVARPAFRANHAVMMSHGRRGLAAYVAGMRLGRSTPPGPVG